MTVLALLLAAASVAARPSLIPVRHPSLVGLEPAVAAQLREVRERLQVQEGAGRATAETYGDAGRHYHAYEMAPAAEDCYRNAEVLAPDDFRWPYLRALLLEQDSRLEEAAQSLERVLAPRDKYYPALIRLAAARLSLGRPADAGSVLALARTHAPADPALLAVLGEVALAEGRFAEAAQHLTEALRREPRATRLRYPLAMAYRSLGRLAEAQAELQRVGTAGIRPKDPLLEGVLALRRGVQVHVLEAERASGAGDHEAAAAAYRRALAASPEPTVPLLLALAAAEARRGRFEDALAGLRQAMRIAPDDFLVLYNTGLLLAHLGRHAEAEPVLKASLARRPDDMAARVELVLTLVALGRRAEAEKRVEDLAHQERARLCPALLERLPRQTDAEGEFGRYLRAGPCAAALAR